MRGVKKSRWKGEEERNDGKPDLPFTDLAQAEKGSLFGVQWTLLPCISALNHADHEYVWHAKHTRFSLA